MLHWVEKASLEKIRWLLEISEQQRHYEVLLTLKNLVDVRQNPAPYSLSIIPHPLPLEIVEGEHFSTANLLNLTAGSVSSSRDLDTKTSSWELVSRTPSGSSASTSGGSGSAQPSPILGERGRRQKNLSLPRKGTSSTPRVLKIKNGGTNRRRKAPEAELKDFVPWVCPESSRPSDLKEGEEEEEMIEMLDRYATGKWKQ